MNNRERTPERMQRLAHVIAKRQRDLTVVLANIHDPHNVSAIYRSCDAFGVAAVHLYYTNTAFPSLSGRSSASAKKWVATERHNDSQSLFDSLRAQNMRVLATSCSPSARPLSEYDLASPVAIVLGNEHSGVDSELVDKVDGELYIPMYGMIQSFNVSVAAAIILAEASRQRLAAGKYDTMQYSDEEFERTLLEWSQK